MYANLLWLDHAITPDKTFTMTDNGDGTYTLEPYGTIVQQGTNLSAANFQRIEDGNSDHDLALQILTVFARQLGWEKDDLYDLVDEAYAEHEVEEQTVTLTNSQSYPFNDSTTTVTLETSRNTTNYTVDYEVTDYDGNVGEIVINESDKGTNAFKIAFTGSATSVTVDLKIRGGIIA